jgi:hypothetical protein
MMIDQSLNLRGLEPRAQDFEHDIAEFIPAPAVDEHRLVTIVNQIWIAMQANVVVGIAEPINPLRDFNRV